MTIEGGVLKKSEPINLDAAGAALPRPDVEGADRETRGILFADIGGTVGCSTTILVDDQVTATQTFHENGNIDLNAERLVRKLERWPGEG